MGCELIVMGASWGGLHALEGIFGALPERFRTPIAVAQHRAARSSTTGSLPDLLGSGARHHQVLEPSDKEPIESGRIYLAPADYHLLVEPYGFALSTDAAVQHSRPSIDVLFESAADTYGDRLAAVILTGANHDGAEGIKRIRRRGGLTVAQEPATAERSTMPAAAIATGAVQHVLPLEEIAPLLVSTSEDSRSAA
jgi:two-component system, chemotaxis family, protein-glutamate methylesterase/glutaminase